LLAQKSEHEGKHHGVRENGSLAGLARHKLTRGDGQEETGAEGDEKGGGDEEIRLGERDAHGLGDERVHEEKDEGVEKDGHLIGTHLAERHAGTVRLENHTRAEGEEKSGGDGNLLGRDVGNHFYYVTIFLFNTQYVSRKLHEIPEGRPP